MLYAIIGEDNPNSLSDRLGARPAHLKRLDALKDQGRLVSAGPFPAVDTTEPGELGFTGSLIIAEFSSLDEAQFWASDDPYCEANVYKSVEVKPYKQVYP